MSCSRLYDYGAYASRRRLVVYPERAGGAGGLDVETVVAVGCSADEEVAGGDGEAGAFGGEWAEYKRGAAPSSDIERIAPRLITVNVVV